MCTVSVIMPVYNAGFYLKEAIESIIQQSYTDFEFLIFNDGSSDSSAEIVKSFTDSRIRFFDFETNSGYVVHLNTGIAESKGKYIARMDADDIAHPLRLEKQVAFLENNPEVSVVGAWLQTIEDQPDIFKYPETHGEIMMTMLNENPMGHPVVMMRKEVLLTNHIKYEQDYVPAEDFKLWTLLSGLTRLANIQEVLLFYRKHQQQISTRKAEIQNYNVLRTQFELLKTLVPNSKHEFLLYEKIKKIRYEDNRLFVHSAGSFISDLIKANDRQLKFPVVEFRKELLWEWYCICNFANQRNYAGWKDFYNFHPYKSSFHAGFNSVRLLIQNLRK